MSEFTIILIGTVIVIILLLICSIVYTKCKRYDIHGLRCDQNPVSSIIYKYCLKVVYDRYTLYHKQIYRKDGHYMKIFENDVIKEMDKVMDKCFDNKCFRQSFEDICANLGFKNNKILRSKLYQCIVSYISAELNHDINSKTKKSSSMSQSFNDFVSVEDFKCDRSARDGDCVGVYVLHNQTKDKNYVGQATRLYFRVNQHITGHGNGDVYADYKNGDIFVIKLFKLVDSGYDDLDKFEKDMIKKYDAYTDGYNKTAGNG